jgi:Mycothiol maleylpyruvate isomerase N-terminal domain
VGDAIRRASATEIWPLIHEQRNKLGDLLQTLSDAEWVTPSLCHEWQVRDVVAEICRNTDPILHGKERSAGLTLRASDVAWSAGAGSEVTGPLASIILAITGRQSALDDLSGKGLDTLRSRA